MSGNALWLVGALLVLGALPLALVWRLGFIRIPLVVAGKVRMRDIALSRQPWPEREKQVSNAFDNQFQLPMLFALAALLALYIGPTLVEVILGWLFVVSRYVHAVVHVTDNHLPRRFAAYTFGLALLTLLWLELAVRWLLIATGAA